MLDEHQQHPGTKHTRGRGQQRFSGSWSAQLLNTQHSLCSSITEACLHTDGAGLTWVALSLASDVQMQPVALFVLEYSLARLLQRWGVQATAVVGHSVGEYDGAAVAGVMSLHDAVHTLLLRGALMKHSMPATAAHIAQSR